MQPLDKLKYALEVGDLRSQPLIDACLAKILDEAGQGPRAFLSVFAQVAKGQADIADEERRHGYPVQPFAGIPISVKDLFDTNGQVTRAASHVLDDNPPASKDADAVAALRRAGFIIIGKNHMTEFAYSGLGMNIHFPVPLNPFERSVGRIPGGSTSGGAVAVADGMVPAALGSDTGGSCRIPAAFCGIVGFKPTARRISKKGAIPLSETLDAIGTVAGSVSCCSSLDAILSGESDDHDNEKYPESTLCLGVVDGYVDEKLDKDVSSAYAATLTRLSQAGVRLAPVSIPALSRLPHINRLGGFVGAEAYAWHRPYLESRSQLYDPWILARFEAGRSQTAADYIDLLHKREDVIHAVCRQSKPFDAIVMPTVQIAPPTIASLSDSSVSNDINMLCLRNTAIANFLDRPAISIPCHETGAAPVGFMLIGETLDDKKLLKIAKSLESIIRPS